MSIITDADIPHPSQDDNLYGRSTMYWIELIEVSLLNGNTAAAQDIIKRFYAYNKSAAPDVGEDVG